MGTPLAQPAYEQVLDQILGYLNFSSGAHDPKLFLNLDLIFQTLSETKSETSLLRRVRDALLGRLGTLATQKDSFKNADQAEQAVKLVFDSVLDDFRAFHSDVLFHQKNESIYNSFFVAKALQRSLELMNTDEAFSPENVLRRLNDFIGHRPVATLETHKAEPYEHEWVCPIPLLVKDAGAAHGPYKEIVEIAIDTISKTDPNILRAAHFDLDQIEELAFDPRAFDFDHPINRRPNHHFGQWDEHSISSTGFYSRFIVHEITLSALLKRVIDNEEELPRKEVLFEAGAVLAGTILMASAIGGSGPGAYDSNTSLSDLLPIIAGFRDQFYSDLITQIPEAHRDRLMAEANVRRQPFGGARQALNSELGNRRARQLVNCRLASLYAQMGYAERALEQSTVVPITSARMNCQLDCLLATSFSAIKAGELEKAYAQIPKCFEMLRRAIDCGAIVDPWNILGFDANYSLFPAVENSVRDHRVDDLVELMHQIFSVCSHLWADAAAKNDLVLGDKIKTTFLEIVDWWRQYAAHQVTTVETVDAYEDYAAAELVARALNLWHKNDAASGDVKFWANHARMFDSSSAYDLVIDALLQREDFVTSMALLMHWLSNADRIPLQQAESSFHDLMFRWISAQKLLVDGAEVEQKEETWNRIRKFYDFLEANADYYWQVPKFLIGSSKRSTEQEHDPELEDDDETDELLKAAYEGMTYQDTTNDGFEGAVFDTSLSSDDELEAEVDRVMDRLDFLGSVADYWRVAATIPLPDCPESPSETVCTQLNRRREIYSGWMDQVVANREQLADLLKSVHRYRLPSSGPDQDSLMEYDRHRLYKESLLQRIIDSCVQTENAVRMLGAVVAAIDHLVKARPLDEVQSHVQQQQPLVSVFSALLLRDSGAVIELFPSLSEFLNGHSLLYIPLSKGGDPSEIVRFRSIRGSIVDLLRSLPALGLLVETHELLETSLAMERNHPPGAGSITEFDGLFKVGFCAMVKSLTRSTNQLREETTQHIEDKSELRKINRDADSILFGCVELLTESLLIMWLEHSRTLRLSVLEKVNDDESWTRLCEFIQKYGAEIFNQPFLRLSNVRAILHQGVGTWLEQLERSANTPEFRLLDELDQAVPRNKAIRYLTLILEAVIDNYGEYRDYNASTTQSDRGELLYILLDFLRLRRKYDRVCWHLSPVVWAHEILVRWQVNSVARMWRRSLVERVDSEAQKYLDELDALRVKYSVKLTSIGRHLEGRFVQPMQIDRLRAQVEPAMREPDSRDAHRAFELLVNEIEAFTRHPSAGIDVPDWLAALEEEVHIQLMSDRIKKDFRKEPMVEPLAVPISDLREQLETLPQRQQDF